MTVVGVSTRLVLGEVFFLIRPVSAASTQLEEIECSGGGRKLPLTFVPGSRYGDPDSMDHLTFKEGISLSKPLVCPGDIQKVRTVPLGFNHGYGMRRQSMRSSLRIAEVQASPGKVIPDQGT